MELKNIEQASEHFLKTQDLLKVQLRNLTMTASEGQADGAADKAVSELIKPSIFDTEETKRVKGIMTEVQEYIDEIEFTRQNKATLDKERAEAKSKQEAISASNVPEGFGKPQPNAHEFKTVSFTVKPKKRTHQEMAAADGSQQNGEA